jgi:hypothetical protein
LEQQDQVKDYLAHLDTRLRGRKSRMIYLTPDGRQPDSLSPAVRLQEQGVGRLHCWSYQIELRAWLEDCRRECQAPRIRDLIKDFMGYIDVVFRRQPLETDLEYADEN